MPEPRRAVSTASRGTCARARWKAPTGAWAGRWRWRCRGGRGPLVEPGRYMIRVSAGALSAAKPVTVEEDPRIRISAADRAKRYTAMLRASELSARAGRSAQTLSGLHANLAAAIESWKRQGAPAIPNAVRQSAAELSKKVDALYAPFVAEPRPPGTEPSSPQLVVASAVRRPAGVRTGPGVGGLHGGADAIADARARGHCERRCRVRDADHGNCERGSRGVEPQPEPGRPTANRDRRAARGWGHPIKGRPR